MFQSKDIDQSIDRLMNIVNCGGVKLGKKGSIVFKNFEKNNIESKLISAKDTTGAGDMYAAGFLSQFFKTNDYLKIEKIYDTPLLILMTHNFVMFL